MNVFICDEDYVNKTMTNLKVIGKIGPGSKVNTKGKYLQLDDTTYWQGALRWYRGDNRDTMYGTIHNTIRNSLKIVNMAISIENPNQCMEMYNNCTQLDFIGTMYEILKESLIGMENLKDTYDPDPGMSSRLEMDILLIKNQLNFLLGKLENK
jgi:hypothetical protein